MQLRLLWVLLILFTSTFVFAQNKNNTIPFEGLKVGMSEFQLKQMIGEPIHIENFKTVKYNSSDTSVYWRYADDAVVVVTNHQYDRIEKNRDVLLKFIQQKSGKKEPEGLMVISYGKN